jgi:peptide-methionine (R)-S-oxide reductase
VRRHYYVSERRKMKAVLHTLKEGIARRRVFLIAPFAFAGLWALFLREGDSSDASQEVVIVEHADSGQKRGVVRRRRVVHSDAEWKGLLTAEQFYVTRRGTTDTPFTGTCYRLHAAGLFRCVCCGSAVFDSETKFDSDTGWPSFWAPVAEENIRTRTDTSLFMQRTEVSCTLCGAHLGHVFDDGPPPTGLRYCINESSVRFTQRAS